MKQKELEQEIKMVRDMNDIYDSQLVHALAQHYCGEQMMAESKKQLGLPVEDPEREKYIRTKFKQYAKDYNLPMCYLDPILEIVLNTSVELQKAIIESED